VVKFVEFDDWASRVIDNSTRPFADMLCTRRINGNGATERHYGHGFTETVTETDTDERKRNAGNQESVWVSGLGVPVVRDSVRLHRRLRQGRWST